MTIRSCGDGGSQSDGTLCDPKHTSRILSRLKNDDKVLHAEFHRPPSSIFRNADWLQATCTEIPRSAETDRLDEEDRTRKKDNRHALSYLALKDRLRDKVGYHHVDFTNTVSPETCIPVILYQSSHSRGEEDKIDIGTATARFKINQIVSVELDNLLEPDLEELFDPDAAADTTKTHVTGGKVIREPFCSLEEMKDGLPRLKTIDDLANMGPPPSGEIEAWLRQSKFSIQKDSIDPIAGTMVSESHEQYPKDSSYRLAFGGRDTQPRRVFDVIGKKRTEMTIEYSDIMCALD